MILIVFVLNRPYAPGPAGLSPELIEETTAAMEAEAPAAAALPCRFDEAPPRAQDSRLEPCIRSRVS